MDNLSERDVKNLAEGRYNRRWRKAWYWVMAIAVLVLAGMLTWQNYEEGPTYKWTLENGTEIIGEKSVTPMFWVDGEFVDVQEETLTPGKIAPFTVFVSILILGYFAFLLYIRKQQRFADAMAKRYKESGVLESTLIDYTPLKRGKKKKS